MALDAQVKAEIVEKFSRSQGDTGSTEVQVAILSRRIKDLMDHFDIHSKDHSSRRGLLKLVARRRALLKYLKRKDPSRYQALINELGLRR